MHVSDHKYNPKWLNQWNKKRPMNDSATVG